MAVNQEYKFGAGVPNPLLQLNIADWSKMQPHQILIQLQALKAEQFGWYLVPPSPPPPQAFMINEADEGADPEENVQDLVNALDNVALHQPGVDRDPSTESLESTRRI